MFSSLNWLIYIQSILYHWDNQRPFWECPDEIDVTIFADALVALYRFSPPADVVPLFKTCLEAERSDAVKLVAIKASVTLSVEVRNICYLSGRTLMSFQARAITWQPSISPLFEALAGRFRTIFKVSTLFVVCLLENPHTHSTVAFAVTKWTRTVS